MSEREFNAALAEAVTKYVTPLTEKVYHPNDIESHTETFFGEFGKPLQLFTTHYTTAHNCEYPTLGQAVRECIEYVITVMRHD